MTAAEINRGLAEAMEWTLVDHEMFGDAAMWIDLKTGYPLMTVADFSPATDSNHLRLYVYPEIERRGLQDAWIHLVLFERPGDGMDLLWFMATAAPAVLAEAALKVLREQPQN